MVWIIVWSELLTNLAINKKMPIILINGLLCTTSFFILVLTNLTIPFLQWKKKVLHFHYTFFDIMYLASVNRPKVSRPWPHKFRSCFKGKLLKSAWKPVKCNWKGVHFNIFENLTPSQTFLNGFKNSCETQIWRTTAGGSFRKSLPHFSGQSILAF